MDENGFNLLSDMLTYAPNKRLNSKQLINHSFFKSEPLAKSISEMPKFKDWKGTTNTPKRKASDKTGNSSSEKRVKSFEDFSY